MLIKSTKWTSTPKKITKFLKWMDGRITDIY